MRQSDIGIWSRIGLICGVIAALAVPVSASVRAPDPVKQMIADPRSGLAMFGYDPVAFHSEGRALAGKPQFRASVSGLEWRFVSAANRAVFEADPETYIPLFGGHDGVGISTSKLIWGDPAIFLIAGGRTVFFRSPEDRDIFARDGAVRAKARELWPQVARDFAGH